MKVIRRGISRLSTTLSRLFRWEFWPTPIFYFPIICYLLPSALYERSLLYLLAANPGIELGGLLEYSKFRLLEQIPAKYRLRAKLFDRPPLPRDCEKTMSELGINYPIILKPDKGERGRGVARIANRNQLQRYLACASGEIILQEFIAGDSEFGILTMKNPITADIELSSLVIKKMLMVIGDGQSTLRELISRNKHARFHKDRIYRGEFRDRLHSVLGNGEKLVLGNIGNHARGAIFKNGNKYINDTLSRVFEPLVNGISGFYIGRFDIKAESITAIEDGVFKVLEVNGINSEPAHIYELGLFSAWGAMFRHWRKVSQIARANITLGAVPARRIDLISALYKHYCSKTARNFKKFTG